MRSALTKNLGSCYDELHAEVIDAIAEFVPKSEGQSLLSYIRSSWSYEPYEIDWVEVPGLTTMQKIVARASNRIFVGAPLCEQFHSYSSDIQLRLCGTGRDEDYVRLNIDFTLDVFKAATVINLFPDFMKGCAC